MTPQTPNDKGYTRQSTIGNVVLDAANRDNYADVGITRPLATVRVLSPRGLEYLLMHIALWFGALGLIALLVALIGGQFNLSSIGIHLAVVLGSFPVFALLFLRLKSAEISNPTLKSDSSRRRLNQITATVSFVMSLSSIIGLIFSLLQVAAGNDFPVGRSLAQIGVVCLVSLGMLVYFWRDETRIGA